MRHVLSKIVILAADSASLHLTAIEARFRQALGEAAKQGELTIEILPGSVILSITMVFSPSESNPNGSLDQAEAAFSIMSSFNATDETAIFGDSIVGSAIPSLKSFVVYAESPPPPALPPYPPELPSPPGSPPAPPALPPPCPSTPPWRHNSRLPTIPSTDAHLKATNGREVLMYVFAACGALAFLISPWCIFTCMKQRGFCVSSSKVVPKRGACIEKRNLRQTSSSSIGVRLSARMMPAQGQTAAGAAGSAYSGSGRVASPGRKSNMAAQPVMLEVSVHARQHPQRKGHPHAHRYAWADHEA